MGSSDRHSKATAPFAREELERLAAKCTVVYPRIRGVDRPVVEQRPTCKLQRDEILGLAVRSARAPTEDKLVNPGEHDRRTQQIDPKRFQQLMRDQKAAIEVAAEVAAQQRMDIEAAKLRVAYTGHELARIAAEPVASTPEPPVSERPFARVDTSVWMAKRRESSRIVVASLTIGLLVVIALALLLTFA